MLNHNKIFNDIILQVAREKLKCIRVREYSLEYYLHMFNFMSNDVVKWKSLELLKDYKPKKEGYIDNKGYHYKTIQNAFGEWAKLDIFRDAHNRYLKKYYFILKPHLLKMKIKLYIDTTYVWNKYGVEYIGVHPEYKKKKATKIGSIVDSDGDILSILNFIVNETIIKDNDFEYTKKTFNHDVMIMQNLFDNIIIHFDGRKNIYCGADKSFITKNIIKCQTRDTIIITPKRKRSTKQIKKMTKKKKQEINIIQLKMLILKKDQKKYLNYYAKIIALEEEIKELNEDKKIIYNKKDQAILSERNKVEDNYKNLKKAERITIRKDKKIKTFMSFIFMDELKRLIDKYSNIIVERNLYYL